MVIDNYKSNYIIVNIVLTWSNLRILGLFKELKFSPNNKSQQEKLLTDWTNHCNRYFLCLQIRILITEYDQSIWLRLYIVYMVNFYVILQYTKEYIYSYMSMFH